MSSIEDVINWLLENPDMSGSEMMESDGREAAAVEGIANSLSFFLTIFFTVKVCCFEIRIRSSSTTDIFIPASIGLCQ